MSRPRTPGWNHQRRNAPRPGSVPTFPPFEPPTGPPPTRNANNQSPLPMHPPVGSGRPTGGGTSPFRGRTGRLYAQGEAPNSHMYNYEDGVEMTIDDRAALGQPDSASPCYDPHTGLPLRYLNDQANSAPQPRVRAIIEEGFLLGRQVGQLEARVLALENEITFLEIECDRYRNERNAARTQLILTGKENANLKGQLKVLQTHFTKKKSPDMAFSTPSLRRVVPIFNSGDRQSVSSGTSMLNNSGRSPKEITPKRVLALTEGPAAAGSSATPKPAPVTLNKDNIGAMLAAFYDKLEEWAVQYATEVVKPLKEVSGSGPLFELCVILLRDRYFDDIVQSVALRKHLVVAILNHHFNNFLGAGFLENMETFKENLDLEEIKMELFRISPQKPAEHHELLLQRVTVVKAIVAELNYQQRVEHRVWKLSEDAMALLKLLIPSQSHAAAGKGLRDLARECLDLGRRMVSLPREWIMATGERADRWDPHCMVQKDESLKQDPKLKESNGFNFVVRMGISPSFTEKDFSSGSLSVKEVHQKRVLLMENLKQNSTPGSGGRNRRY